MTTEAVHNTGLQNPFKQTFLEVGNTISALEDIAIKSIQNREQRDKSSQEKQVNKIIFEITCCKITGFYCLAKERGKKSQKTINVRRLCPQRVIFFDQWANIPSFFFVPPPV